ncbi:MAG: outer membrane beta-barrel protein [Gammaproteobacteria bacterium]|nr:outer membrane beta-barrel protein [Gammaproteobacteria bacterium]
MNKRNGLLMCFTLVTFVATNMIFASNRPGAVTLTFGDAYYKFDSERHVDATSMPNFALAYDVTNHFGIEGTFGVLNSNLTKTLETGELEGDPAHGFLYTIDGVYRFANYKIIEPYVTVGIGEIGLKPSGYESVQQGLVNAGIGAQAFFDKSLALRAEFRELYTTTGSGFNDYFVNFGISYLIGGEEETSVTFKDMPPK